MRIVFMGTPAFAVPALAAVLAAGHDIACVYTQPPRPAGRGMAERPSAVEAFARDADLPVVHEASLKSPEAQDRFRAHEPDVAVVAAYGLLLPKPILDAPAHGCLNIHASALPRWRGAAPIHRAIMAGDTETGVTIMAMEPGLDTGPACLGERVPIPPDATTAGLHDTLARVGGDLIVRALAALERGSLQCQPQPEEGATYAKKIEKHEAKIDWTRPARAVHDHIRGLAPFPGAWFEIARDGGGNGRVAERVKVWRSAIVEGSGAPGTTLDDAFTVACGEGAVRLLRLQRAGAKPADAPDFLRGRPVRAGSSLG